jgi:ferredoxin-NADP reductase
MEFDSRIESIIQETEDTKTLRLARPADFGFISGQFVNITMNTLLTGRARRAYSIASSPLDPYLDLTVRRVPDGLMSRILTDEITVGDSLNLRGPYGRFILEDRRSVWIAGGSGIVPFRSMWRYIEQTTASIEFTLLYATKSADQIIFRLEIEALSRRRTSIFHTFTEKTPAGWEGFRGRINLPMLSRVVLEPEVPLFYVCGPPRMCDSVSCDLVQLGVPRLNIRTEKYD